MRVEMEFMKMRMQRLLLITWMAFEILPAVRGSKAPAFFVFGDSLVDAGNNNYLNTQAQANHLPYGVHFHHHQATGRFSDGRLIPDLLAKRLGLPYPPAYLGAPNNTLQGVNFGSASSGILSSTGIGNILSLPAQVDAFVNVRKSLSASLGPSSTSDLLSKSIFYICTGNNDVNTAGHRAPLETIIKDFERQLRRLYTLGARKFVVINLSDIGCVPPDQIRGHCNPQASAVAADYNNQLYELQSRSMASLPGAYMAVANFSGLMDEVMNDPQAFGFKVTNEGCCPLNDPGNWCYENAPYCSNSNEYMYWDRVHPTEAFNKIAVARWYKGSTNDISPLNVKQLAKIKT